MSANPTEAASTRARISRGVRSDGIRTLSDLLGRCRVDDETKCWVWAGALNDGGFPVVRIPAGVLRETACVTNPRRVGWLLSGRKLGEREMVIRTCDTLLCVRPDHAKVGSRTDVNRQAAARGSYSTPERLAHLTRARMKSAVDPEKVRAAEAQFAEGATVREASERVGIDRETARRIRNGSHIHQTRGVLPLASVFAWRPA